VDLSALVTCEANTAEPPACTTPATTFDECFGGTRNGTDTTTVNVLDFLDPTLGAGAVVATVDVKQGVYVNASSGCGDSELSVKFSWGYTCTTSDDDVGLVDLIH
jgi:hypothetical protein